jgi:NAD(P)-dependent dehydrogenase (short-subunit alcohol dehydrogenase family)
MRLPAPRNRFSYFGRVVIITGGSRALAFCWRSTPETGRARGSSGAQPGRLDRAKARLDGHDKYVMAIVCDVADRQHVDHAVQPTLHHFAASTSSSTTPASFRSARSSR